MRKSIINLNNLTQKQVWLTSYTVPIAELADKHVDVILVGDSLSMVLYGMESTLQADLDLMIRHGRAVVNSTKNAMIVVDMPFGSYQQDKSQAYKNASKILRKTNCQAIKLEGGTEMQETVEFLTQRAIPVAGHIGLKPQYVNQMGGYKVQGSNEKDKLKIIEDAKAIEKAGAFCIIVEGVKKDLADELADIIKIPLIGIGASNACAGQVLVAEDMLGFGLGKKAKFVKQYANLSETIDTAFKEYAEEVKTCDFPDEKHVY